jgi:hypothetical protein
VDAQTEAHSRENPTLYLDHTVAEEIKATKKRRRAEAEQKIIDEIRGPGGPNDVHAVLDGGTQFVHAVRLPKKRAIAAPVRTQTEVAPREFMEKKKPEAMGGKRPRDEGSEVIGGPKAVKYKRIVEPDNMREHKRLLQLKKDANRLRGSHAMDNQLNFLKEQQRKTAEAAAIQHHQQHWSGFAEPPRWENDPRRRKARSGNEATPPQGTGK